MYQFFNIKFKLYSYFCDIFCFRRDRAPAARFFEVGATCADSAKTVSEFMLILGDLRPRCSVDGIFAGLDIFCRFTVLI